MKKYCGIILTLILMCLPFAQRVEATVQDEIIVMIDDQKVESDSKPFVLDGRTMVALRSVLEHMGATITWNAEDKSVFIDNNQKRVQLFIGNRYVFTEQDGKERCYQIDVAPVVVYDHTYVPLRFVAELFDCSVDYYESSTDGTKMAIIYTPESDFADLRSLVKEKYKDNLLSFGKETEVSLIDYYKMDEETYAELMQEVEEVSKKSTSSAKSFVENFSLVTQKTYTRYNESISFSVLQDNSIGGAVTTTDGNIIVRAVYRPSSNLVSLLSTTEKTSPKEYWKSAGYCEENEERYQAYQEKTGYSAKDVIWRVNARLDLREYEDYVVIGHDKLNQDPLVIVNKYHKIPDDYTPTDLKKNSDGCVLRSQTADAFDEMKRAAAAQGVALSAISGYRSIQYQRNLYNGYLAGDSRANVDTYSARPGHSEHNIGLAIDVYGYAGSPQYNWIKNHCHEYGFIVRYTRAWQTVTGYMDEPWHIRYIGKEHSMKMIENNIGTLEEYVGRYGTFEC